MKFLVKHRREKWTKEPLLWAVEHNDLDVVADLLRNNPDFVTSDGKLEAYTSGKLEMMKYMYEHGASRRLSLTLVRACEEGDLETVKYLLSKGEGFLKTAMKEAVCNGHLEIVKYLHENTQDVHTVASRVVAMNYAALNGHLDILRYLHENAPDLGCTTFAMDGAAMRGHLDVVRFLHEHRREGCTTKAMDQAAANGHLAVVEYLHANRMEGCTTAAMDYAALRNHLDIVRFLHANRSEGCTAKAFNDATLQGRTEVVRFLLEHYPSVCDVKKGIAMARQRKYTETIAVLEAIHLNSDTAAAPAP
ncbi:hypothetical protein PINS_up009357 [Pythium insidiosum]|nr:hypothetical protein PINS_up009357 [Pythium insidiosum]